MREDEEGDGVGGEPHGDRHQPAGGEGREAVAGVRDPAQETPAPGERE